MTIHVKVFQWRLFGWCTCKWWQCNNFCLGECDKPRQLFKEYLSLWNCFDQLVRPTNFVGHNQQSNGHNYQHIYFLSFQLHMKTHESNENEIIFFH
jgi:hypothetical protein